MSQQTLAIAILNLMPTKETTARHLTELLTQDDNIAVEVTLLYPESHYQDKEVPLDLQRDYLTFNEVKEQHFDGYIITGAPIEQLAFEEIDYWEELCEILGYLKTSQTPLLSICWGAQAALYYYYQIEKELLPGKTVGVFEHEVKVPEHPLTKTFGASFSAPHSRYTTVKRDQVEEAGLINLASSKEAGLYLLANEAQTETYVFGHAEYDTHTLAGEYQRDLLTNVEAPFPKYYFPADDPKQAPTNTWAAHGEQLFNNWINLILSQQEVGSVINL